jgi:phage tail protein X
MPALSLPAASHSTTAGPRRHTAATWLRRSVIAWTCVALLGQLVFAAYVLLFYGISALAGEPRRWNQVLPHGWKDGAVLDNSVLAAHLMFTVVIVLGGLVQLLPVVRRRVPWLHRWTGRTYLLTAAALSLGGLYLVWVRGGAVGDLSQHLAITGNALIILGAAAMAWRAARARRIDDHRRWALRVFVAVSGVWFFRVGLMAWLGGFRAPLGFDADTFSGPFLTALAWGVYVVVPLLILEAVLRAQRGTASTGQQAIVAVGLALVTMLMAFGVVMATAGMWGPRIM